MKYLIFLNVFALALFLTLYAIVPLFTNAGVRLRYVELDRAGVINETALSTFHPSFGFQENPRHAVPRFIAGPALSAETTNALLGVIVSSANLLGGVILAVRARRHVKPVSTSETPPPSATTA